MSSHDPEFIVELFAEYGPVRLRRMFGGMGIFADELMIGLVAGGAIYLRATDDDIVPFEREGMTAFSYDTAKGTRTIPTFWRMPERLYDDPDELVAWARRAQAAVLRIKARPKGRQRTSATGAAGSSARERKPVARQRCERTPSG